MTKIVIVKRKTKVQKKKNIIIRSQKINQEISINLKIKNRKKKINESSTYVH